MYALLDTDNTTVLGCLAFDMPYEEMLKEANGRILVKMTPENSPAYVKGSYVDGKFYPPKEIDNG